MGQPDLYPFIISPAVVDKLGWVHDLIRRKKITVPGRVAQASQDSVALQTAEWNSPLPAKTS
jgi:hypothetical protein